MLGHGQRKIRLFCFYPLDVWSDLFTEPPKAFFFSGVLFCWVFCLLVLFWLVGWWFCLVEFLGLGFFLRGCLSNTKDFRILNFKLPEHKKVSKKTLHWVQCREGWSDSFYTNNTACGESSSVFCRLFPQICLWITWNCTAYVFNYLSCFKV